MKKLIFLLFISLLPHQVVFADVVKPALVEIRVNSDKFITIEVRASIEALLTGINAKYTNTQDAPMAKEYDEFRKLSSNDLQHAFVDFKQKFIDSIYLKAGDRVLPLIIDEIEIPATGYTKVPRISVIQIKAQLPESANSLQWYYPEAFGNNAVRVKQIDEDNAQWYWSQWQWLRNDKASTPFSLTEIVAPQSTASVISSYLVFGFEHIIPSGLDHILFILGLFLLSRHWRPLLLQITMFTVAHTITLGLAMNNVVELPSIIVEPLIALSIVYVGVENLLVKRLHKSRLLLVFMFGLVHGLGFAGVLTDFGMPINDFLMALISFNVGVELGQIAIILLAYGLLSFWIKERSNYRRLIIVPGSLCISVVGVFWFFERLEIF